jgi:polyisoprenoid-binding protein YceI
MSLPLSPGTWVLDQLHTTIEFSVRHLGISKVRGRFTGFDATVVVGDDLSSTTVRAEVDLSTVDTGNADRDDHLRGSDFFQVDAHPKMVFESTGLTELGPGRYQLDGTLSLNGHRNPQRLAVEFFGVGTFPGDGSTHAGFAATGSLSRKAFGVDFNVPMAAGGFVIGDQVNLELDVQLCPAAVAASTGG